MLIEFRVIDGKNVLRQDIKRCRSIKSSRLDLSKGLDIRWRGTLTHPLVEKERLQN